MSTLDATQDEAEYVCLDCIVPGGCNESDARCLYRILRPPQRTKVTHGKQCPHPGCSSVITNESRTCRKHRWYK